MKKILEIKGCKKEIAIETCGDCPLLNGVIGCKHPDAGRIDFSPHTLSPVCPLPDAPEAPADVWPDDENHRLGPNSEWLISVVGKDGLNGCSECFYSIYNGAVCTCDVNKRMCSRSDGRNDERNIHWELAGDRK